MGQKGQDQPRYRELQGELTVAGLHFAVVVSRFNAFITERLLQGALDALRRAGADEEAITVVRVPGAFEIPVAAKHLAQTGRYNAIVCLGTVIRGETPHFEYISAEASKGVAAAAFESGVPMSFGILTVENLEQAVDRAGLKSGNKGFEAAMSAVEMANLIRKIKESSAPPSRKRRRS
ncbi:MAG: 6,7-dimethyl-8-ribityllumazine synthase [Acidobacteria bacterium RIFCSPLOWO2_02_FULL_61_28]|nr:MAG: 6,7-dimethyl-8-ribityllumazine synthase [Acidobacteria bacterium RIFCSPLOWO2_02_FULL_61_28]